MRKALVVGINKYPTVPLAGCIKDATLFGNIISRHGDGQKNFEVRTEFDVPTKRDLRKMISELFATKCDLALFYYSGHGFINELGGYIVTPDHQKYDEGVPMDEILQLANNSKATDKVIILDCCNAGAMGSPVILNNNASHITEGVTILTSSMDHEPSREINGLGVFTNLLLSALEGGAANVTGEISPGSVYAYIDKALGLWDQQRPVFKTNVFRFNSLRTVQPQISLDILRKITEYFSNSKDEYKLNPSYEDQNSPEIKSFIKEPYANQSNVKVLKHLQAMQSVGLVVPVDAPYMFFAAMNSKSCKLTPLGQHYWNLVKDNKL